MATITSASQQIKVSIPDILKTGQFRFIRLKKREKDPVDKGWTKTANYAADDPVITQWLDAGGNYGVMCVDGDVAILDADNFIRLEQLGCLDVVSETLTVRTGSEDGDHYHFYLKVSGLDAKKIPLFDLVNSKEHLGELYPCGSPAYCVGPGCIHPSGSLYTVMNDEPIRRVSLEDLDAALFSKVKSKRVISHEGEQLQQKIPSPKLHTYTERQDFRSFSERLGLRIEDVAYPAGEVIIRGDEIQGAHPHHGSTTGSNFSINTRLNVFHCFPPGTLVHTSKGMTPIEMVDVGDSVYDIDGKLTPVNTTFRQHYSGDVYTIHSALFPVTATKGHEIYVARCIPCSKDYESYTACKPNCKRRLKDKKHHCTHYVEYDEMWIPIEDINPETDFLIVPKNESIIPEFNIGNYTDGAKYQKRELPSTVTVDSKLASVMGWYLADGSISGADGCKDSIQITLGSNNHKKDYAEIICDIISNKFGFRPSIFERVEHNTRIVNINSKYITHCVRDIFGTHAQNKSFGSWLNAPCEISQSILDGYLLGDGHIRKDGNGKTVSSTSRKLIQEAQILLLRAGIFSRYYFIGDSGSIKGQNYPLHGLQWSAGNDRFQWFTEKNAYIPINSVLRSDYHGDVYNLETGSHSYQVPFVVHNCFRCDSGGDPLVYLAIQHGVIRCEDAGANSISGEAFRDIKNILRADPRYTEKIAQIESDMRNRTEPRTVSVDEFADLGRGNRSGYLFEPILEDNHFLNMYTDTICELTDSYRDYQFAAGIQLLSMMTAGKIEMRMSHAVIKPSFFFMLLGASSYSKKTTAIRFARKFANAILPRGSGMADDVTPERFVQDVSEVGSAWQFVDEASALLQSMKTKAYMAPFREMLCKLYDGEPYHQARSRRRGRPRRGEEEQTNDYQIDDSFVSLLYATTPDSFSESTVSGDLKSGLFYRFCFIYPTYDKELKPSQEETPQQVKILEGLQNRLDRIYAFCTSTGPKEKLRMRLTDDASEYLNAWEIARTTQAHKSNNPIDRSALSRTQDIVKRLAMVFEVGSDAFYRHCMLQDWQMEVGEEWFIPLETVKESCRLVDEYFTPVFRDVMVKACAMEMKTVQERILRVLDDAGGKVPYRVLQQSVRGQRKNDFAEAIGMLSAPTHEFADATHEIEVVQILNDKTNRSIKYVVLTGLDYDEV